MMLYHTLPLTYAGNGWNVNAIPQKRLLQLRFRLGYIAHCHLYSKIPNILAYESRISSLFRPLTLSPNGIAIWCNILTTISTLCNLEPGTTFCNHVTTLCNQFIWRWTWIKHKMLRRFWWNDAKYHDSDSYIVIILACDINFYRMKSTKMSEDIRLLYW